ncbi:hypothetical protein ACQ4PT_029665 [Festuca glaucescens]
MGTAFTTSFSRMGDDAIGNIPTRFLSKSSGNLKIDDLIADSIKREVADDDFLQRAVLVLIATVLAPQSTIIIPRKNWAIVQDVKRIKQLNFNDFTLTYLKDNLKKQQSGYETKKWPYGNLALLQYLYYEKISPKGGFGMTMRPLMRNWTEEAAVRRDTEDYKKGRGKRLIDNDITAKHREEFIRTLDNVAGNKRKTCKKAKAESSSKKMPNSMDAAV